MDEPKSGVDVAVVGGGQAGLAAGYHLRSRGCSFAILEARPRVGDQWRDRWDSLTLFTPARYSQLPGLPLPMAGALYPTKDQLADYLDSYVRQFELPVRTGVRVLTLARQADGYVLHTTDGDLRARSVIVATGPNTRPRIPAASAALDPAIVQLHSSAYRNPDRLPEGAVVVVGAGTSGAEIALELARSGRRTYLAGRPTAHLPDALFRFAGPVYWSFVNHVLTLDTPLGRKVAARFHERGAPLIGISLDDLTRAGVTMLPRLSGAVDGKPDFGGVLVGAPDAVVWATGFVPDLDWLPELRLDGHGLPVTRRGVVPEMPGLGVLGFPFQYSLTSGLIGGVGRDAAHVVASLLRYHGRVERTAGAHG